MKKLLTGNEALARGAYEAGVSIASAYPGTPSTEIMENMAQYDEIISEWSTNEKVALEVASGAAISGARSMVSMKHVGVNVAADPLFTMAYEGVNGGLVIVSADEPGMHSSQNEQDNRLYANHSKVALIEPSDSQECKDFVAEAFKVSEEFDTPVILRVTTRVCHSKGLVEFKERNEVGVKNYEKDITKYVMVPAHSGPKHREMEEVRIPKMREYSNQTDLNRIEWNDKKIGIVANGISYLHAKEVFGEDASYLKIGFSWPMPDKLVKEFADGVDELYVIEENEPYMEDFIKAMGIDCTGKELFSRCGEISPSIIRQVMLDEKPSESIELDLQVPNRPPTICAGCPHRGMFHSLGKHDKKINVTSDIGCYSLGMAPPLSIGDTVICMGAGVSAGIGFDKANKVAGRDKKVFGIVGDSTFFHSGMTGLANAVYNNSSMALIILDNRTTAMTGHQENPGTGRNLKGEMAPEIDIKQVVKALGVKEENIRTVDPYILDENEAAINDAFKVDDAPFVIIAEQACALLKDVQKERRGMYSEVNQDICIQCGSCLEIGCPAISMVDDVVSIDKTQCNGCTICSQVCPIGSIENRRD